MSICIIEREANSIREAIYYLGEVQEDAFQTELRIDSIEQRIESLYSLYADSQYDMRVGDCLRVFDTLGNLTSFLEVIRKGLSNEQD